MRKIPNRRWQIEIRDDLRYQSSYAIQENSNNVKQGLSRSFIEFELKVHQRRCLNLRIVTQQAKRRE